MLMALIFIPWWLIRSGRAYDPAIEGATTIGLTPGQSFSNRAFRKSALGLSSLNSGAEDLPYPVRHY